MNDNRKFTTSFSVRIAHGGVRPPSTPQSAQGQSPIADYMGTQRVRVELSEAPLHGGPEGLYRVRIDRRWYDSPEGSPRFMDRAAIAELVVDLSLGALAPLPQCPAYHPKARMSVRYTEEGVERCVQASPKSQPVRLYNGKVYVCVHTFERGTWFAPWEDIIIRGICYAPQS